MFYAIFEDGSRQYRVSEGDLVILDYREDQKGTRLEFNKVMAYRNGDDTRIGQPLLEGVRVVGEVVGHPSEKYIIQKFRKRKNYRRLKGHRQHFTEIRVQHILLPGQDAPAAAPKEEKKPETPAPEQTPATT
jgi:large subunit ribosomal protein L21